jgi:hypothetical protein
MDFTKCEIGTKVWDKASGKQGIISNIEMNGDGYPIGVSFNDGSKGWYTSDGRFIVTGALQLELAEEIKIEPAVYKYANVYELDNDRYIPYYYDTYEEAYKNKVDTIEFNDCDFIYEQTVKIEIQPERKFKKVTKWEEVK